MRHPKTILTGSLLLAALLPAAMAAESGGLAAVWQDLVGQRGVLEEKDCGYVFTLSTPTQSGNAVIKSVADDHVVIVERRDQTTMEYVVPLQQISLRRHTSR